MCGASGWDVLSDLFPAHAERAWRVQLKALVLSLTKRRFWTWTALQTWWDSSLSFSLSERCGGEGGCGYLLPRPSLDTEACCAPFLLFQYCHSSSCILLLTRMKHRSSRFPERKPEFMFTMAPTRKGGKVCSSPLCLDLSFATSSCPTEHQKIPLSGCLAT